MTKDVGDHQIVLGNPARFHGYACRCGRKLTPGLKCEECKSEFVTIDDRLRLAKKKT
ncbi:MAG: hypothetical protein ACREQQ_08860 [Candidatus Binatia bacterium]